MWGWERGRGAASSLSFPLAPPSFLLFFSLPLPPRSPPLSSPSIPLSFPLSLLLSPSAFPTLFLSLPLPLFSPFLPPPCLPLPLSSPSPSKSGTERELFCFAPGRVQTHNVKSRAFCVVHLKCFLIYITLIPSPRPPPHQSFQISLEIYVKHAEGKHLHKK